MVDHIYAKQNAKVHGEAMARWKKILNRLPDTFEVLQAVEVYGKSDNATRNVLAHMVKSKLIEKVERTKLLTYRRLK